LDSKRIISGQILDDLASLATNMPADRSRDLTKDLDKVLFALFMDTRISLDELRIELTRRIERLQPGRPSLSLIQGGAR
jgi:hypothetical protein